MTDGWIGLTHIENLILTLSPLAPHLGEEYSYLYLSTHITFALYIYIHSIYVYLCVTVLPFPD